MHYECLLWTTYDIALQWGQRWGKQGFIVLLNQQCAFDGKGRMSGFGRQPQPTLGKRYVWPWEGQ